MMEKQGVCEKPSTYGPSMYEGHPARVIAGDQEPFQVDGGGGLEKL